MEGVEYPLGVPLPLPYKRDIPSIPTREREETHPLTRPTMLVS